MSDPHLSFRKPPYIIKHDGMSWSGKYYYYLGHHFHEGHECWVMGAYNVVTDKRTERHYSTVFGAKDPKAECLALWQPFEEVMLRAPADEETNEVELDMKKFLQREAVRKGIKPGEQQANIVTKGGDN